MQMQAKKIKDGALKAALNRFLSEEGCLSSGSKRGRRACATASSKGPLDNHVLFNPYFDVNGALYLRRLFSKGAKIVLMLRPCEIRAYVELVKLTQVEPAGIIAV